MDYFFWYLIEINFISFIYFGLDKHASIRGRQRVSESFLHLLEAMGGIFAILLAFHIFRHKRGKFRYYIISYLILFLWILGILGYFQISYELMNL